MWAGGWLQWCPWELDCWGGFCLRGSLCVLSSNLMVDAGWAEMGTKRMVWEPSSAAVIGISVWCDAVFVASEATWCW